MGRLDLIYVNLNVADVERSIEFYTDQLGFEQTWGFEPDGTIHRYIAADNGVELQLSKSEDREDGESTTATASSTSRGSTTLTPLLSGSTTRASSSTIWVGRPLTWRPEHVIVEEGGAQARDMYRRP